MHELESIQAKPRRNTRDITAIPEPEGRQGQLFFG